MARYFFHVRDGDKLIRDPEGVDLSNLDAAVDECVSAIRGVLSEEAFRGELAAERQLEITDEHGRLVLIIPFLG